VRDWVWAGSAGGAAVPSDRASDTSADM
jgi:hypothetical protein